MRFRIHRGQDGYAFDLVEEDGATLLTGAGHADERSCKEAIRRALVHMAGGDHFHVVAVDGGHRLYLKDDSTVLCSGPPEPIGSRSRCRDLGDTILWKVARQASYEVRSPHGDPIWFQIEQRRVASRYRFDLVAAQQSAGLALLQQDDHYYFLLNDEDGSTLLYSQAFEQEAERERVLASLRRHEGFKLAILESGGMYYLLLRDAGGHDVARSRRCDSVKLVEEVKRQVHVQLRRWAPELAAVPPPPPPVSVPPPETAHAVSERRAPEYGLPAAIGACFAALLLMLWLIRSERGQGHPVRAQRWDLSYVGGNALCENHRVPDAATVQQQEGVCHIGEGLFSCAPQGTLETELIAYLGQPGGALPRVFALDQVRFEADSYDLLAEGAAQIADLALILQNCLGVEIEIRGHAGSGERAIGAGGEVQQAPLALLRADAVQQALVAQHVGAERVQIQDEPAEPDDGTEQGRARGRRVEIAVTKR